jgi:hypothetical protein
VIARIAIYIGMAFVSSLGRSFGSKYMASDREDVRGIRALHPHLFLSI